MTLRYLKKSIKIKNYCTGRFRELLDKCFVHVIVEPHCPERRFMAAIFYPDSIENELKSYEALIEELSYELDVWLVLVRAKDVIESKKCLANSTDSLEEKIIYLELQRVIS
ncbi:hypothetical protein NIES2101_27075 [Calothrix sp. HK-06]|nr:hypothetical protein NIES2101_27075 [Calothrix sp. HK-06]